MNANDLVSRMLETQQVTFSFGKNGWGLSDEFISIGNRLKELSEHNNVYLKEAKIDTLDDVYDLTFELYPHVIEDKPLMDDIPVISYNALRDRITDLIEENKILRKEIDCLQEPKAKS